MYRAFSDGSDLILIMSAQPEYHNALKQVDLKKGKSQAYEYVKKMQAYAKELYNKNYR